ncbi:MAG: 16S rRNA (guanine(966)-N(2))-methyltransferase RsmD [Bacilli bacterium]|nr:16S rRNA (guanine(966)-N(2))-methyltransferase RsmD [Bacilli bacterium]
MRVISGKYKGSNLLGHDINGTRPTMDRVKESMFAMIQSYIKEAIVLDLFAGSGALGIEALSNGANTCYFVDNNGKAIEIIKNNLNKIKVTEKTSIIKSSYIEALKKFNKQQIKFDIIILDPPYAYDMADILKQIYEFDLLKDEGIVICEFERDFIEVNGYNKIKEKIFKDKKIFIFKKNQ